MDLSRDYGKKLRNLHGDALFTELSCILEFMGVCGFQRSRDRGSYLIIENAPRLTEDEAERILAKLQTANPNPSRGVRSKLETLASERVREGAVNTLHLILNPSPDPSRDVRLREFIRGENWREGHLQFLVAEELRKHRLPEMTTETAHALLDHYIIRSVGDLINLTGEWEQSVRTYADWALSHDREEYLDINLRQCVHWVRESEPNQVPAFVRWMHDQLVNRKADLAPDVFRGHVTEIWHAAQEYDMPGFAKWLQVEYDLHDPDPDAPKPQMILR